MDTFGIVTGTAAKTRWSLVAVLAAMAVAVLDSGMVTVALPTLGRTFATSPATTMMIVAAYQLAVLMTLLPCAHLAERVGQRKLFAGGLVVFSIASLACAAALSIEALIVFRFVQGLGAAAIMALGIALLRATLGTDRLAAAIAWNALTVAICSAAGPAVGALLLSIGSWQWIFVAGLPLSAIALSAVSALSEGEVHQGSVDGLGILLHLAAAAMAFLAFKWLITDTVPSLLLLSLGVGCIAVLARRATLQARPLIPFDLLAHRHFRHSVAASICCFVAQSIGMVMLPFHLEGFLGRDPMLTGMFLAIWPVSVAIASAASNRLFKTDNRAIQCTAGATLLMSGLLVGAAVPSGFSVWPLAIAIATCGAGFGLFQLANNRNLFLTTPAARSAATGGMQGTARLAGQTTGTLLASLVFHASSLPAGAPRIGFFAAAGFALLAAVVTAGGSSRLSPRRFVEKPTL